MKKFILLCGLAVISFHSFAQGTSFTYQGRLADGGAAANGSYDLRFALFDAASGGAQQGSIFTNAGTFVSNGLFTVTLDFGNQFSGADRWLEIAVRTNDSVDFTTLSPRQKLTSTPYATRAAVASAYSGTIADNQLSANVARLDASQTFSGAVNFSSVSNAFLGSISGNAAGVSNLNLTANSAGTIIWGNSFISSSLNVGDGPTQVIAADVNGDGKADLISANTLADTFTILTNNGSGGFALASSPAAGDFPYSVVAADFNDDGKIDLACVNLYAATITVLTNNASGGFIFSGVYGVDRGPYSITAADVNGDGKADLVSACSFASSVTVLTNTGFGNFMTSSTNLVGDNPVAVVAVDVNGDGKVDLITANDGSGSGNTLTILTNSGVGTFALSSSPIVGSRPNSVIAVDLDGDGSKDLASANFGNSTLTVLTNNGSGSFGIASSPSVGLGPIWIATADVDADGRPDLITANSGSGSGNTFTILTNRGIGTFVLASSPTVGKHTVCVVSGDANGDGRPDLISADYDFSTLTVLINALTVRGSFLGSGSGLTNLNATSLTTGTLADARLSVNVAFRNSTNLFTSTNTFSGVTILTNANNVIRGVFTGNAAGLTNLNATNLSGTLPRGALSGIYSNAVQLTNSGNIFVGNYSGNASGLTNISGNAIIGGLTTNLAVLVPGGGTNTLYFTNGVLRAVQ